MLNLTKYGLRYGVWDVAALVAKICPSQATRNTLCALPPARCWACLSLHSTSTQCCLCSHVYNLENFEMPAIGSTLMLSHCLCTQAQSTRISSASHQTSSCNTCSSLHTLQRLFPHVPGAGRPGSSTEDAASACSLPCVKFNVKTSVHRIWHGPASSRLALHI